MTTPTLASYLCDLASRSECPKGVLTTCLAPVSCMTQALKIPDPVTEDILKLSTALVKSCTSKLMQRSKVMPVEPFTELFLAWPGNWCLSLEDLRLKTITLLALSVMLRPSDVAPRSKVFQKNMESYENLVLTVNQIKFESDGSVKITFFGIKNDYHRDGFEVVLHPLSVPCVDPVCALRCYIDRTKYMRPEDNPLFIALKAPFKAISVKTVSCILDKAIDLAGLGGMGFSAKSYRPTGATRAIDAGLNLDVVMKVGR